MYMKRRKDMSFLLCIRCGPVLLKDRSAVPSGVEAYPPLLPQQGVYGLSDLTVVAPELFFG